MGSPLSPVAACLYMKMMESKHFLKIMRNDVLWFRYLDDVLIVAPIETDLEGNLKELNEVEKKIQFTVEKEQDDLLPFLYIQIMRNPNGAKFEV